MTCLHKPSCLVECVKLFGQANKRGLKAIVHLTEDDESSIEVEEKIYTFTFKHDVHMTTFA